MTDVAVTGAGWTLRDATPADAETVHALCRAAFAGQDRLDPPSGVFRESVDDVALWLRTAGGLVAVDGSGEVVGTLRFQEDGGGFWLRRVAVRPDLAGRGIGSALVVAGEEEGRRRGYAEVRVGVRRPLVDNLGWWQRRGYAVVGEHDVWLELARPSERGAAAGSRPPVVVPVPTVEEMQELGRRIAVLVRAGDLLLLSGDLGAGKTALTQGIGAALGVRGPVTSPTFVIARVHPSVVGGPPLVHVDAYRLGSLAEVDDLDLDATLDEAVTVVEWGGGLVEGLSDDRLDIVIRRSSQSSDETRTVTVAGAGSRWSDVDLTVLTGT